LIDTSRVLSHPMRMIEPFEQKFDSVLEKLNSGFERHIDRQDKLLHGLSGRLQSPRNIIDKAVLSLDNQQQRLQQLRSRLIAPHADKIESLTRMLETLSYKSILNRGYAVLKNDKGDVLDNVKSIQSTKHVKAIVKDGDAILVQK